MRFVKFMQRPSLRRAWQEAREAGIPDLHDHPPWHTLPKNERFYLVFAHPFHSQRFVRTLLVWERRGLGWWMDLTLDRWARLPKEAVDNPHRFRL